MLPMEKYLEFTNLNPLMREPEETAEHFRMRKIRALMGLIRLTYRPEWVRSGASVLEVCLTDHDYACQFRMDGSGCTLEDDPAKFVPSVLKVLAPLRFFNARGTLQQAAVKNEKKNVDFYLLVAMTQRCAKSGRSKTMSFDNQPLPV